MTKWRDYQSMARERGSLAAEFFVALSEPANPSKIPDVIGDHLAYQSQLEEEGALVFAGPLSDESGEEMSGGGLIVYRAASMEDARAIADKDPMHASGARSYVLRRWMINEGRIQLDLGLSTSVLRLS